MFQNSSDLGGNDLVWRNKPKLRAANEENRKLNETLDQKKIEVERLKSILEDNSSKGKNMQEFFNNLCQTLNYKQQLLKSREHELEMEVHGYRLIERECSRLEQEAKFANQEIKFLIERQNNRKTRIEEQNGKSEKLKSEIQWEEDALLNYLEKSAQMEKDNMALLKYASEDDSKINELGLYVEKLNKELHERKSGLDDADTEVFIVQSELDKMQQEFRNAYNERCSLINNWEKVMNQIKQRNTEVKKLSEDIIKMQDKEKNLKREEKEQLQLLTSEITRNNNLENNISDKDKLATKLHNDLKCALAQEEDLTAQLATVKNASSYLLYQKQAAENTLSQLEKQLNQKNQRIEEVKKVNENLEKNIEDLNKETFEADHYIKELELLLQKENRRNLETQKNVELLVKDTLLYTQELTALKVQEKVLDNQTKNCQAGIRNLNSKIASVDRLRTRQESELYEIESNYEKLQRRIQKMIGVTNEEEKRKVEKQKSHLLSILGEKKKSLTMLTEELKIMTEKITLSTKELEIEKKLNSELGEKIKALEFYISNSLKSLRCSISRKQDLLVQECFVKFHMKRCKKILNTRNKSMFNLQKSKAEFETMMKERIVELKNCNALLETEIRLEDDECNLVKRKHRDSKDKLEKLKSKYKMIMDALGVSEPGDSAEAEILIKAEEEKRDLMYERDKLLSNVLKDKDELSSFKNTLWAIKVDNEQFRQVVYPAGISLEDSQTLRSTEEECQSLGIKLHICKGKLKILEDSIEKKKEKLNQNQNTHEELQGIIRELEAKHEAACKEISDIDEKILRAEKNNSRLGLELRKKQDYAEIEEDIRIHLLREIRRTVSDLLFSVIETKPETAAKIEQLFEEAQLPLPARARSSMTSRSGSASSLYSKSSSSSQLSSRTHTVSPSIVKLQPFPPGS